MFDALAEELAQSGCRLWRASCLFLVAAPDGRVFRIEHFDRVGTGEIGARLEVAERDVAAQQWRIVHVDTPRGGADTPAHILATVRELLDARASAAPGADGPAP